MLCDPAGGDLFDRMNKHLIKQHAALSEREAAGIMRTIVSVIAHCHERGVMHRDVKLENFVFTDDTEGALLKAVDFGLSTNIQVRVSALQHTLMTHMPSPCFTHAAPVPRCSEHHHMSAHLLQGRA